VNVREREHNEEQPRDSLTVYIPPFDDEAVKGWGTRAFVIIKEKDGLASLDANLSDDTTVAKMGTRSRGCS